MVESLYQTTFTRAEDPGHRTPTIFTFYVHFVVECNVVLTCGLTFVKVHDDIDYDDDDDDDKNHDE